MDFESLQTEVDDILTRMDELNELAVSGEGYGDEQKEEYSTLESRLDSINEAIERHRKLEARKKSFSEPVNPKHPTRVEIIREENHNDEGEYRGFGSLGEQLIAIANASRGVRDSRLDALDAHYRATGMNEGTGSEGGFAVQTDFVSQIQDKARERAPIASRCRQMMISSNSNGTSLPLVDETSRATGSRYGGVRGYWVGEGTAPTASEVKLRNLQLNLQKLAAVAYVTEELNQDAMALESFVGEAFMDELAWLLDDAILNGDGAAKCLGILNGPATIAVAKEAGPQTADTVVYANVRKIKNRIYAPSRRNAVWLVHADVPDQLEQTVLAGSSSDVPIWLPAGGISGREFETLYGHPVIVCEQSPALGDLGDIMFVDLSQYLLIRKSGINSAQSAHVKFVEHEMTYRWTMRVNGVPLWNSALTDAKGSNTRSPYVTLAARA